jgi:hypothetical protein
LKVAVSSWRKQVLKEIDPDQHKLLALRFNVLPRRRNLAKFVVLSPQFSFLFSTL